ncbi:MAG: hypothetical protein ABIG11_06210 [bacterium]
MQKKRGYLVSISIMAAALMSAGVCGLWSAEKTAAVPDMVDRITVSGKITDIELELQGSSDIVFVETENVFEIKKLKYYGISRNPIKIQTTDTAVKLIQKSEGKFWFKPDPTSTSYKLFLPKNRRVHINADKAIFSGKLTASDFLVNAGNLNMDEISIASEDKIKITGGIAHLNMKISKCKELKLTTGNISGKITAPDSAKILNTSGVSTLIIYRNSGSKKTEKETSCNEEEKNSTELLTNNYHRMFCAWPVRPCR